MYKIETHDNSRDYFKSLNIEKDSIYITPTTSFSNMLKELSNVSKEDKWRVIDIEKLTKALYGNWIDILNQISIRSKVREIILELMEEISEEDVLDELKYLEDNIVILMSDINFLVQTNLSDFNYSKSSITKKTIQLIYNRLIKTQVYKDISNEILNPIMAMNFYKKLEGYSGGTPYRIYFYNINNVDLNRWLITELLKQAGFEVIFRIPYFHGLSVTNKSWDMVYGNKQIFDWSKVTKNSSTNYRDSKFINFLEGHSNVIERDEKVITKTYAEVSDFRRAFNDNKVITFYKDSLGSCKNNINIDNEDALNTIDHCFQTTIGRFLMNLYSCNVEENIVHMDFNLYRELITSGWIEYKGWNGIRLGEYLSKNDGYFNGVSTIDEIIDRINALKDLEDVNEIFEDQVKIRVKKDGQKKFLSNPFRAFGYNNLEDYNITVNYMLQLTIRLKNFILKAFENNNGLIDISTHFEMLRLAFRNTYIIETHRSGSKIEVEVTTRVFGVLNNLDRFPKKMHKDDIVDLFSILLKLKKPEGDNNREEADFSIDQLEGIIHRNRMVNKSGEEIIYISDLSYKAYEKYTNNKYVVGKILNDEDFEDIFETSLVGKHKEMVVNALNFRKISIKSTEAYLKFIFANLFINFNGVKELSWISGLRNDDSKSIIFKQIETIYENNEEVNQYLDVDDIVKDEEIKNRNIVSYDNKELKKSYEKYSDVAYRDLDFCTQKFLYSSVLNPYPIYYSDFHNKLVFSGVISVLKNSMDDSYLNISKFVFPLFPQWKDVVKSNILTCEYGRKNMRDYKYFDNINYPKNIDSVYLLKSKYVVGERWKIKNRYKKGNFNGEEFYSEFLKDYLKEDKHNSGTHCMMCPHVYLCRKGDFTIDSK